MILKQIIKIKNSYIFFKMNEIKILNLLEIIFIKNN
jgi:hypothetical protein